MSDFLSFRLPDEFVDSYASRTVNWGYPDVGGNSIGEITFLRTYSRRKPDGSKERWHEVCRRVVEGMYSIQKDWCKTNRLPWNENKAYASAKEAYERMFEMKWLPPGRGLWMMGTEFVHKGKNSAALQNCAFVSTGDMTKRHPEKPFLFLMEASMLGVGVGFDTEGATRGIKIYEPVMEEVQVWEIPDTREGWVESVGMLLRSYLTPYQSVALFDYSKIRPAGQPIKTFGGTAAGPDPLIELHDAIRDMFAGRKGETVGSRDIVDIANLVGKCVVSGNVRRSAEIALGHADDKDFLNLKNYDKNPERAEFGWVSNNSVHATVGMDYTPFVENIVNNGEPGFFYLDLTQKYGRLVDPPNGKDWRAVGTNPCSEQTLESYECCTLVENFIPRADDKDDFMRSLKFSYLYAKSVTLLPTHWPETNAVMQRNRRIGCSVSGMAQFVEREGWHKLRDWLNDGYHEVQRWDRIYSEWLGVRESIKTTSIKPSGTVSLLAGVTPGAHWPTSDTYIRRIRLGVDDPLTESLRKAGYLVEPAIGNEKTTVVVEIPVRGLGVRTESEVSIWEKAQLAVAAQKFWADNQVSVTLTFNPKTEGDVIEQILRIHEGEWKSVSFLPMKDEGAYKQMPYENIPVEMIEAIEDLKSHKKLNWNTLYSGTRGSVEALGETMCTTDVCEIKTFTLNK